MENNQRIKEVCQYLNGLYGTVQYRTTGYIGFKTNSKMYVELSTIKNGIRILVNKKYVTTEELETLNIAIASKENGWTLEAEMKIGNDEALDTYKIILKRAYEGTKQDYEMKIKKSIDTAIESSNRFIKEDMEREIFSFEKLEEKWLEFNNFEISNNALDELKSDIESLDKFRSQEILENYKNDEIKYRFITLINEVVSYVDLNAFNKSTYNQYEDKRILALTFVRQKDWVKNLISYKKYNDLNKLTEVVRNVIMYINSPQYKITGFVNSKLLQFCKLLDPNTKVENNYPELCKKIFKELEKYNIQVKNPKNVGKVYGKLMFEPHVAKLWDIETTYMKLQPYNTKGLSIEEVDNFIEKGIMVSSDKSLELNNNYNIFYTNTRKENYLMLGTFTSAATKHENGIYYRKFESIEVIPGDTELPNNKAWGSKYSSKSAIAVKNEEKQDFENAILNKSFNVDVDELLSRIDKMDIEHKNIDINEYTDTGKEDVVTVGEDIEEYEEVVIEKEIETPLNMILYGPPGTGKTYNTVNYAVSIVEKKEIEEVVDESKIDREAVFKRYKKYLAEKKIVFTTFHQNYSYEEFIQGIRANTNNTDQLSFVKQDGVFKDLVERAKNDLENYYVMIIDEINRGNISRIFGELITLIEDDKRLNQANETLVTLPSKEVFGVPSNLFILGTMNTADKSIALIDIALRRRFEFIAMYTDYSVINEFEHILKPINKAIYEKKRSADYMIGHAFFVNKTMNDLEKIINNKIIPLLNEYFNGRESDVIDVLARGGINIRQCEHTFQLLYDDGNEI
ncbi:McrB family protein [Romboutsia sp.]|uniref:McrB family protein n=1 Tax=Romboutsia sp. TaxID=1965302 RepID=UPI003F33DDD8